MDETESRFKISLALGSLVVSVCLLLLGGCSAGKNEAPIKQNKTEKTVAGTRQEETLEEKIQKELGFYEEVHKDNDARSRRGKLTRVKLTKPEKPRPLSGGESKREPGQPSKLMAAHQTGTTRDELSTTSSRAGIYSVQVGAFGREDVAKSVAAKLKSKGYRAYVEPPRLASFYRVRIGRFKTKREAERVSQRLKNEGFQTIIRKAS